MYIFQPHAGKNIRNMKTILLRVQLQLIKKNLINHKLTMDNHAINHIIKLTCEKVWTALFQPKGLLVQFACAAVGSGYEAVSHGLHTLFAVRVQEKDDGVPLSVIQGVHSFGSHIQQSVTVLQGSNKKEKHVYMLDDE